MNRHEMLAVVKAELQAIPRGSLNQNVYRSAYEQARLNSLSTDAEASPEAAHATALRVVRRDDPGFGPDLR